VEEPAAPSAGAEAALLIGAAALALFGLYGLPWLAVAPNRLLAGEPVGAVGAIGPAAHALALIAAAAAWRGVPDRVASVLLTLGVAGAVGATGIAAPDLLQGRPPAARVLLGGGFWMALAAAILLLALRARAPGGRAAWRAWWPAAALAAALALLWRWGALDALSLVAEYRARAEAVQAAVLRHLALSAAALGLAAVLAVPLGWWAFRSARAEALVGGALSGVQVVPALALFGLLIPLLSALLGAAPWLRAAGLEAIGAAPALLAVSAYAALPLWRAVVAGLGAADPAAVAAARAMGMTEGRIAAEIRIPLGLPVFAAGLRVAAVQCIGLATLGGLVGAGGLGAIVFEGMAQFAADLILVGALPIVALALLADTLLRGLEARAGWRGAP
jgi:osmoprotectant transport system permease protein